MAAAEKERAAARAAVEAANAAAEQKVKEAEAAAEAVKKEQEKRCVDAHPEPRKSSNLHHTSLALPLAALGALSADHAGPSLSLCVIFIA